MNRADKELFYFCYYLNNIIEKAIEHGGDVGGPYYSDKDSLIKEMKNLIHWLDIKGPTFITIDKDDDIPKFYVKRCD